MNSKQLGVLGEKIACLYLENKGYKILDKNYSRKWVGGPQKGEIDIVTEKNKTITFVEVKTLISAGEGTGGDKGNFFPEDRVDFSKQRKLIKLAENWLSEKKIPLDSEWQIDVIGISIDRNSKKAKIQHFQNVVAG